jgi:hypothetical protein
MEKQLKEIFHDLHNIEINIIFRSGMTGRKFPDVGKALDEIAVAYERFLGETSSLTEPVRARTKESFDKLKEAAEKDPDFELSEAPESTPGSARAVILRRIWRNCWELSRILDESNDKFSSDDLLAVRKIWEVGTEVIVMQTVVQLDGDIVTRIDRAHVGSSNAPVQQLHKTALETAMGHWQFLFETLATLAKDTFTSFLGQSPDRARDPGA